jgi:hypothetical protein
MKRDQADDIEYLLGWFCGAVFIGAPVAAIVYLFQHRRRSAFQAILIGAISLACIVGARALMLATGGQHRRSLWTGLNIVAFVVFPTLALVFARAIPWPHASVVSSSEKQKSAGAP